MWKQYWHYESPNTLRFARYEEITKNSGETLFFSIRPTIVPNPWRRWEMEGWNGEGKKKFWDGKVRMEERKIIADLGNERNDESYDLRRRKKGQINIRGENKINGRDGDKFRAEGRSGDHERSIEERSWKWSEKTWRTRRAVRSYNSTSPWYNGEKQKFPPPLNN